MQLLISKHANLAGLALPDQRRFVLAPGGDVTVETVVGKINLPAGKPFRPRTIPLQNFFPRFEPVQFARDPAPEFVGIVDRFFVETLVFGEALDVGVLAEFRGRLELALLLQNGIDVGGLHVCDGFVCHDETSTWRNLLSSGSGPKSQKHILHRRRPDVTGITGSRQLSAISRQLEINPAAGGRFWLLAPSS